MGPIDFLANEMILPFLVWSYNTIIPNYGVGVILITLITKVIFYPLTVKQFRAMKVTQQLQPRMKKIQEKYKGQPEKLQKEMVKLWKENNANPLTGCWPILVQIPIFFAIFKTMYSDQFNLLLSAEGANRGLFSFWLTDLSLPDPLYLLPIVMGLATYLSQKLTTVDPKQAKIMMLMPFILVAISINMPAGVLLYWATSQVVTTVQQYAMMRDPQPVNASTQTVEVKTRVKKKG